MELLSSKIDLSANGLHPRAIERALKNGLFVVLLDGMDEVSADYRGEVSNQIISLAQRFSTLQIIVSSRPDDRFVSWDLFEHASILPFDRSKAEILIARLEYEPATKKRFAHDVKTKLYDSHRSFLSNPLLLTIMLMTYSHNASIPAKNHLFYSQVFDALWNQHDATKDGYTRVMECGLQRDDFVRLLESVSFQSWYESQLDFTPTHLANYVRRAKQMTGIVVDPDKFVRDATGSVCVLVKDGLSYSYSHRSFQEYYAATFLLSQSESFRSNAWGSVCTRAGSDEVLALMWEINQSLVERELLIPFLTSVEATVAGLQGAERVLAYMGIWVGQIYWSKTSRDQHWRFGTMGEGREVSLFSFMARRYLEDDWLGDLKNPRRFSSEELLAVGINVRTHGDVEAVHVDDDEIGDGSDDDSLAQDLSKLLPLFTPDAVLCGVCSSHALDTMLGLLAQMRVRAANQARSLDELFKK